MRQLAVAGLLALYCAGALAQARDDALDWLQSIYNATRKLSYSGTFVYRNGQYFETSRIAHSSVGGRVQERIEVLDGSPREIIRVNDEVRCFIPGTMTIKVEKLIADRPLLPVVPMHLRQVANHYHVRKGELERIAGFDCQAISLEPKDAKRYGYKLWADLTTRMVLKAQTLDAHGAVVEGFTFTQVSIGGAIPREQLRSRFTGKAKDWRVEESGAIRADLAAAGWVVGGRPAGFETLAELKRRFGSAGEVGQIVLSDGIAAVSVFIEHASARTSNVHIGASRQGAINVFTRRVGDHLVTVVGDAPAESVQTIADGIEYRRGR
jgi:sigma-E factor negative regulatory protein RseB